MALLAFPSVSAAQAPAACSWKAGVGGKRLLFPSSNCNWSFRRSGSGFQEPVAFVGGIFAGLLRLDLNEEPLREWVARTVEASGIAAEDISKREGEEEEQAVAQQIEIE